MADKRGFFARLVDSREHSPAEDEDLRDHAAVPAGKGGKPAHTELNVPDEGESAEQAIPSRLGVFYVVTEPSEDEDKDEAEPHYYSPEEYERQLQELVTSSKISGVDPEDLIEVQNQNGVLKVAVMYADENGDPVGDPISGELAKAMLRDYDLRRSGADAEEAAKPEPPTLDGLLAMISQLSAEDREALAEKLLDSGDNK